MAELHIIDPSAPRPYDTQVSLKGLGGTEATVLKVASALAPDHEIIIGQAARQDRRHLGGIRFVPMDLSTLSGRTILVINSWKVALKLRRSNREARIVVWLHIHPGKHNRQMGERLRDAEIDVICVSRSHALSLQGFLPDTPRIGHVYNPIPDDLQPDETPRCPNRLVFASSPHKGLKQVIGQFVEVRKAIPDLRLVIANPGYMSWPLPDLCDGIIMRGALDHPQMIAEFRRSLCLFYPQTSFAETFGLVIAEANAVGCPALLHGPTGANREIASDSNQCLEDTNPDALITRLKEWRERPPAIRTRPEFRLSSVTALWRNLLKGPEAYLPGLLPPVHQQERPLT